MMLGPLIESTATADAAAAQLRPEELALAFQAVSLGLALEALTSPVAVRPGLGGELASFVAEALQARTGSKTA